MLDMFSIDKTSEERLEILRTNIKEYQKTLDLDTKKSKIKLFFGDIDNFNDGILVITSAPKAKFFESSEDKLIINLLNSYDIKKFFITYNYLLSGAKANAQNIKDFGHFIRDLTDIINPKVIVCMGETSQFCFFKKKFIIGDFHGKKIGEYESRPIMTTFPISYYEERSKFEDNSYKTEIRNKDWNAIKLELEGIK